VAAEAARWRPAPVSLTTAATTATARNAAKSATRTTPRTSAGVHRRATRPAVSEDALTLSEDALTLSEEALTLSEESLTVSEPMPKPASASASAAPSGNRSPGATASARSMVAMTVEGASGRKVRSGAWSPFTIRARTSAGLSPSKAAVPARHS
jgi:hypothetical protein